MKQVIFFLMVACSGSLFAQEYQPIAIGASMPMADTKMKSVDGNEVSINDAVGKNGLLVMFSCNTCPVVKRYQGRTLEAIKQAEENGFGVIIVNSNEANRDDEDSYTSMQEYGKRQQYKKVPYVVDKNSKLANAFGATRTPESFLFNSNGQLVYHGAIDNNPDASEADVKYLTAAIAEVKSGKPVKIKQTRFVGCGIKRAE